MHFRADGLVTQSEVGREWAREGKSSFKYRWAIQRPPIPSAVSRPRPDPISWMLGSRWEEDPPLAWLPFEGLASGPDPSWVLFMAVIASLARVYRVT